MNVAVVYNSMNVAVVYHSLQLFSRPCLTGVNIYLIRPGGSS